MDGSWVVHLVTVFVGHVPFSPDHAIMSTWWCYLCRFVIMSYVTLLQNGLIRFAMVLPLNHPCSSLLERKLSLQLLTGEEVVPATAQDEAHADIHARGFWGRCQGVFYDVRVFHPNGPSCHNSTIPSI